LHWTLPISELNITPLSDLIVMLPAGLKVSDSTALAVSGDSASAPSATATADHAILRSMFPPPW
jgi:hypothetical protein